MASTMTDKARGLTNAAYDAAQKLLSLVEQIRSTEGVALTQINAAITQAALVDYLLDKAVTEL